MKNSSEEKNDSSEVSFDSSEEFFLSSEEFALFLRTIWEIPPRKFGVGDAQQQIPRRLEARNVKNLNGLVVWRSGLATRLAGPLDHL